MPAPRHASSGKTSTREQDARTRLLEAFPKGAVEAIPKGFRVRVGKPGSPFGFFFVGPRVAYYMIGLRESPPSTDLGSVVAAFREVLTSQHATRSGDRSGVYRSEA